MEALRFESARSHVSHAPRLAAAVLGEQFLGGMPDGLFRQEHRTQMWQDSPPPRAKISLETFTQKEVDKKRQNKPHGTRDELFWCVCVF